MSLSHFDEGVYVACGIRAADGDLLTYPFALPMHAPPLYVWLLGAAYRVEGVAWPTLSIVVNMLLGAASVPLMYFLARRLLEDDRWALAAAALLAVSDLHVAISRMALTDTLLTFWFLLAMYGFLRLWEATLECPAQGPRRRAGWGWLLVAGLATAAAWNTKYNGWMPAAIGLTAALLMLGLSRWRKVDVSRPVSVAVLGWFTLATLIATAGYLPWYLFVERHLEGGYAAVTANHASYVGGPAVWPQNSWTYLSSLPAFRHFGWLLVCLAMLVVGGVGAWRTMAGRPSRGPRGAGRLGAFPAASWLAGLLALVWLGQDAVLLVLGAVAGLAALAAGRWPLVLTTVWLGGFVVLAPQYHPFVRLALPAVPPAIILSLWLVRDLFVPDREMDQPGRRLMQAGVAAAALLLCAVALLGSPFGSVPSPELWRRWTSRSAYRAFSVAVEVATPRDAAVICQGQPPFAVSCPRQAVVLGNTDFSEALQGIPNERPTFLAADFRWLNEPGKPTAREALERYREHLEPVVTIAYDANIVTLLDYLTPRQTAAKLATPVDDAATAFPIPPPLDANRRDIIVLYRVNLERLRAAP